MHEVKSEMRETGVASLRAPSDADPKYPENFCPNCSAELKEHRCKAICPRCGFYLSCSDFY
jgi:hypothetical protein